MPSRIVTSTYRYKRPPRKRKAVPLEGPAIVRRGTAKPETPPGKKRVAKADGPLTVRDGSGRAPSGIDTPRSQPAAATPRSAIVTVKLRPGRFGDVPDMTLEESQRRGDAADALFREIVRRATE
jgi:hypothetical protein